MSLYWFLIMTAAGLIGLAPYMRGRLFLDAGNACLCLAVALRLRRRA